VGKQYGGKMCGEERDTKGIKKQQKGKKGSARQL
jgi:hypothetical protein